MFSWQIQIYLEETDTWTVKLFIYFAGFQVLLSWHFFPRAFLTLNKPFCSSLLPRSEIQTDHKSSPSAVTHICEPKGVENSCGYLEDSSLVLRTVPGHRGREECVTLVKNWGRWHEASSHSGYNPVKPGAWGCYSCLSWDRELSAPDKEEVVHALQPQHWKRRATSYSTWSLRGSDKWWKGVFHNPILSLDRQSSVPVH